LATEATKKILSQSLGFRKSKAVKAISDVPGNTVADVNADTANVQSSQFIV
jgi:hypothetical protein